MSNRVYTVLTDLDPESLTAVGFAIMEKWISFAMGKSEIASYRIEHPTGRYASAIRLEGRSETEIAIIADEEIAPEIEWLEEGHRAVDLKTLLPGRRLQMHRGREGQYGSAGYSAPVLNMTFGGRANNVWATPRAAGRSGFARVPSTVTAENAASWIIPAMAAWSPAQHLAEMVRNGSAIQ